MHVQVLAPKSTMSNWQKEFKKWLPDHRLVYIGGTKEEREEQLLQVAVVDTEVDRCQNR